MIKLICKQCGRDIFNWLCVRKCDKHVREAQIVDALRLEALKKEKQ